MYSCVCWFLYLFGEADQGLERAFGARWPPIIYYKLSFHLFGCPGWLTTARKLGLRGEGTGVWNTRAGAFPFPRYWGLGAGVDGWETISSPEEATPWFITAFIKYCSKQKLMKNDTCTGVDPGRSSWGGLWCLSIVFPTYWPLAQIWTDNMELCTLAAYSYMGKNYYSSQNRLEKWKQPDF